VLLRVDRPGQLGELISAGLPAAIPVWQAVAENRTLGPFEALRSGLIPLVGREEKIELLLRRWTQAKGGSGKVVLISGEPGVGEPLGGQYDRALVEWRMLLDDRRAA